MTLSNLSTANSLVENANKKEAGILEIVQNSTGAVAYTE